MTTRINFGIGWIIRKSASKVRTMNRFSLWGSICRALIMALFSLVALVSCDPQMSNPPQEETPPPGQQIDGLEGIETGDSE